MVPTGLCGKCGRGHDRREVADQLAAGIRAGELMPGAALPSVRQLAADLLVSVITVKGAYDELERRGLVVSHQGRGTFVAENAAQASRAELICEVQEQFEAAVRAAEGLGLGRDEVFVLAMDALNSRFPEPP